MSYLIKRISGASDDDSLLVLKLSCDLEVPIDQRVFAQARMGLLEDSLVVRIHAYECKPAHTVALKVLLQREGFTVEASITAAGESNRADITCYCSNGEDLQGEYWSAVFVIPTALLGGSLPSGCCLSGNVIRQGAYQSKAFPELGTLIVE